MTQGFCLYDHGRSRKGNDTDAPSKEQHHELGTDPVLERGSGVQRTNICITKILEFLACRVPGFLPGS